MWYWQEEELSLKSKLKSKEYFNKAKWETKISSDLPQWNYNLECKIIKIYKFYLNNLEYYKMNTFPLYPKW